MPPPVMLHPPPPKPTKSSCSPPRRNPRPSPSRRVPLRSRMTTPLSASRAPSSGSSHPRGSEPSTIAGPRQPSIRRRGSPRSPGRSASAVPDQVQALFLFEIPLLVCKGIRQEKVRFIDPAAYGMVVNAIIPSDVGRSNKEDNACRNE
ncbi:hypothetical protein MUK42_25027 [Musa troglodytarum]|uniref:Uncharacterized protein n=1 Tax=Musa troglodytarum TaxID=320322 RepID=A0A9E7HXU5_9LILI|nr:hypothetical protein MUK42_25027 [Musa troglodytarum]